MNMNKCTEKHEMSKNVGAKTKQVLYSNPSNIVTLFQEQVSLSPNHLAIIDSENQITYESLDKISNQFARYLLQLEIEKGTLIGIYLKRSIEMIIIILAILKVGCTYLPISLIYPEKRVKKIVSDSSIKIVIGDSKTLQNLSSLDITKVSIDQQWQKITQQDKNSFPIQNGYDDIAYVMYTSGSTGAPKGVIAKHSSVTRLVKNQNYVEITNNDVFLQISPYDFDGSTFEIWGALLNGAKLVLMPHGYPELNVIVDKIENLHISILFLTTQLFNSLVDHRLESLIKVKQILFGGEVASIHHVKKFFSVQNECKLTNIYGPTESTTFATYYPISSAPKNDAPLPIGKPISGVEAFVLDNQMALITAGMTGELYIGGSGVAGGYLNDEALTAKNFLPNPFSTKLDERIYKTGDMVKYDHNDNIELVGRVDNLVKIRGFRVALEEIEYTIKRNYLSVKNIIVRQFHNNEYESMLIAYIVPVDISMFNLKELKDSLELHLPLYMLPSKYIIAENFPLNHNGKINFPKLLSLSEDSLSATKSPEAFSCELQIEIANAWKEELDIDEVTIHDNFFDIGGHSLKAINILDKFHKNAKNKYLKRLCIVDLFKYSTIDTLSTYILNTLSIQSD